MGPDWKEQFLKVYKSEMLPGPWILRLFSLTNDEELLEFENVQFTIERSLLKSYAYDIEVNMLFET